ncbi:MAG: mechanosensitive ion channel family protein, partial [Burkholderiaceae bacterium]|nr:mechanosensitive ion channel family protein [Burkholderiaceae bacterium]
MSYLQEFWQNNTFIHFLSAAVVVLFFVIVMLALRHFLRGRASAIPQDGAGVWSRILLEAIAATSVTFIILIAFLSGILTLLMPRELRLVMRHICIILVLIQIGIWFGKGISLWAEYRTTSHSGSRAVIAILFKILVWGVALLLIMDNLGVNVTTLVASLGIGGIAVALATQSILGDIFASLSIMLDKPFVEGDFITVDQSSGVVRRIGLKTTRITSLSGEEIVFSNAHLLKSRIHNYRMMKQRQVVLTMGVAADTPQTVVIRIPDIVSTAFRQVDSVFLDGVH